MTKLEFVCSDEKSVALLRASRLFDAGETLEPVRHGRWRLGKQYVECSECLVKWAVDDSIRVIHTTIEDLKYCPNCGVKMDAEV